jgi:uncharacterized cupin superfamily protein
MSVTKIKESEIGLPITDDLEGWTAVGGSPTMKTWIHTSSDGTMLSGIWEATPGIYYTTYEAYEFVHLISGRITITPDGGKPVTVKSGDAFTVERSFKGTWKIEEPARKHFSIKL